MQWNPLQVSLETLVAGSPLMGHELEDRSSIRDAQQSGLFNRLSFTSGTRLRGPSQRDLFCVAPLDLLVSERDGRKQFHLLELNGTGIGGLTNLPDRVVCDVLESLAESCRVFDDPDGVVLLAVSGKESVSRPRMNRLMHEKLLFIEALRAGISQRFGTCDASNLWMLRQPSSPAHMPRPAAVLGYIKDFLNDLIVDPHGVLWLHGRRVMGAVNDRFCRNVMQRFGEQVDLDRWQTMNRCFAAGSDKGLAYDLMNSFVQQQPQQHLPSAVRFAHAYCRASLIETVLDWMHEGRKVVIKPHGTGLGHGIEFFLDPSEGFDSVVQRIDDSLAQTERYYDLPGGALPYTVCEYVDAARVHSPGHPLDGHKYELRVVVYRQGSTLRAFPSIAKIARERDTAGGTARRALINNITASGDTAKVCGTDYMLPLCNERTLEMLGLDPSELESVCGTLTRYVRHILDQVEDHPQQFGLPTRSPAVADIPLQLAAA